MQCTKCGRELNKSRSPSQHHVFPVRYFGKGKKNKLKLLLCVACHQELELIIWHFEDKIINLMMAQQGLTKKPGKERIKRIFCSMKNVYLTMANDYVNS